MGVGRRDSWIVVCVLLLKLDSHQDHTREASIHRNNF